MKRDYIHHYAVKFQHDGKTTYGVASPFESQRKGLDKRGEIIVADAVLPASYVVRESELTDIEPGDKETNYRNELDRFVDAEHEKAIAADRGTGEGLHVGSLFKIGVGDGYAWYVVTEIKGSRCKVEWRGFCLDRWTDHHFGWGGSFARKDVERYVLAGQGMRRLFGG